MVWLVLGHNYLDKRVSNSVVASGGKSLFIWGSIIITGNDFRCYLGYIEDNLIFLRHAKSFRQ